MEIHLRLLQMLSFQQHKPNQVASAPLLIAWSRRWALERVSGSLGGLEWEIDMIFQIVWTCEIVIRVGKLVTSPNGLIGKRIGKWKRLMSAWKEWWLYEHDALDFLMIPRLFHAHQSRSGGQDQWRMTHGFVEPAPSPRVPNMDDTQIPKLGFRLLHQREPKSMNNVTINRSFLKRFPRLLTTRTHTHTLYYRLS